MKQLGFLRPKGYIFLRVLLRYET